MLSNDRAQRVIVASIIEDKIKRQRGKSENVEVCGNFPLVVQENIYHHYMLSYNGKECADADKSKKLNFSVP